MNSGIAGLAIGVLALVASIVDSAMAGRFLDRLTAAELVEAAPAPQVVEDPKGIDELQALRMAINDLNNELLGLNGAPIKTVEQLTRAVSDHLAYQQRRESIHRFVTRKKEIKEISKDWADQMKLAFKLSDADDATVHGIMDRLRDQWLELAATTGGEPDLEAKIEALLADADRQILAVLPEAERKRYHPINRGWSSGLVGDPDFKK